MKAKVTKAKRRPKPTTLPSFAEQVLASLGQLKEAVDSGDTSRLTVRTVNLRVATPVMGAVEVRAVREQLGLSQALFARFLGADAKTVQAWEQGLSTPSGVASRWLDEIRSDPNYWTQRLKGIVSAKA